MSHVVHKETAPKNVGCADVKLNFPGGFVMVLDLP